MENKLQIFSNQEFGEIRIVTIGDRTYFVGVDIARALEYSEPHKAVTAHCRDGGITYPVTDSLGRQQETKVIPEGDLYRLIVKAADQSKNITIKEKAERFERWLFDEVLPSIRKHGAYLTDAKIEEVLIDPDTIIRLATDLKAERQRRTLAEARIEEMRPKEIFADAVSVSDGTILIGELAKILKGNGIDIGQNRLFERLRQDGYLIKRKGNDYNAPTQKAMELGLFKVKETAITHSDGHITISRTTKVTGKGQIYFINKFKAA